MTIEKNTSGRKRLDFEFNGDGGDYFGIWIINTLLTMVTLGFYSPWAKVRKLQYFYGSTKIAGGSFQFLANPWSMLKFRIVAVLVLIIYFVSEQFLAAHEIALIIYISLLILYFLFAPVLMVLVFSFRLRYSAWRSIRFSFNKDYQGAYRVYMAPNIVLLLLLASVFTPFYLSASHDEGAVPSVPAETSLMEQVSAKSNAARTDNRIIENEHYNDQEILPDDEDSGHENIDYPLSTSDEDEPDEAYDENDTYYEETDDDGEKLDDIFDGIEKEQFVPALFFLILFLLLLPYFDFINTRYIARNARFGSAQCLFTATAKDYYWLYAKICLLAICLVGLWQLNDAIDSGIITFLLTTLSIAAVFYLKPYFKAKRYNLFFGNLHIGEGHHLQAAAKPLYVLWLSFSNTIGIMFSGGLLIPWAQIRTARYYLSITHLESSGNLSEFLKGQEENANALAEELSDVFDIEI